MRSVRFASLRSIKSSTTKSEASPATAIGRPAVEKRCTDLIPETPLLVACQNASLPVPLAATTPSPVMTTRRCFLYVMFINPVGSCENERCVHSAKSTRVGQTNVDTGLASAVWYIIPFSQLITLLL